MTLAYVDTSCLVAIAFGERTGGTTARRLERFDQICAASLLEAEFRAALARENVVGDAGLLSWVTWVLPDRPLSAEISQVLAVGKLRGADLWHLACALYVAGTPKDLPFITLDQRQRNVARRLGFPNR